ncbi:Aste57867_23657 [Aphanomyces stellatus]|uniref:Aste57867_23657 protein n=1 Tax=Aphanomyces stellatus TaxID=120398 RepID=A0A485LPY4_9STRA|nr:hypothetical protein As57867_023585 [Aphanomyces stellatus]VFU00302.1 Aste57867_23657 [Aphanomyces stellatus]
MTAEAQHSAYENPAAVNEKAVDYTAFGEESARLLVARVDGNDDSIEWSEVKEWDGVTVFRGVVDDNDWNCIKAVATVHCSAQSLADRLADPAEMKTFDSNTDAVTVVEVVDAATTILHVRAKAIFPTTARDFSVVTARHMDASSMAGSPRTVIASRSIDHEDIPVDPWYVRAYTYLSGYVLQPLSESECQVTMIVHMNLGGSLPSFVINLLAVDAPIYLLQRLRELYAKN